MGNMDRLSRLLRKDQPKINRIKIASTFQHHSDSLGQLRPDKSWTEEMALEKA